MRSLYVRILLATVVTVAVSLAAFIGITRVVMGQSLGNLVKNTYAIQADQAARALQRGGSTELKGFIETLDTTFGVHHYVTDETGRDLVTGENRMRFLDAARAGHDNFGSVDGLFVYGRPSNLCNCWLLVSGPPPFSAWSFAPFYALVLVSIGVGSWLATVGIASPLRKVAATADQFGRGDLAARVQYRGGNEIGQVARSFNAMADRIQTLLTAERRLLQDISHELRSPLTRMNFAAELVRTAPDRDAAVDRLQVDLDRLGALVAELLTITQAEGDPTARRRLPVDIGALVHEIVQSSQIEAESGACRIIVTGSADGIVSGDAELLRRAIENVLRNAIRYSPPGADVEVTLRDESGRAVVEIRDVGPGVPPEALSRLFEPFFRVDASRQDATGGTGLGLSITYRAVQLHHGSVNVENAHPGLRVSLSLPTNG